MISVPRRLLQEDFVDVLLQTSQAVLIRKELNNSIQGRLSYLAKHVLTAVVQGEQSIQNEEGEMIRVRAGEMAVIRRGLYTITDLISQDGKFTACLLFFEEELLSDFKLNTNLTSGSAKYRSECYRKFTTPSPLKFFWRLLPEWLSEVPYPNNELQNIKIQEFFALLAASDLANPVAEVVTGHQPAQNIRQFVEKHYDKPLSIADYAYLTGRSESTFRREFKTKFGTSPRQWIIRQRLTKAHRLLQTTQKDVTQIAFDVGYENVSHFIGEYKKQYGYTPKQHLSLASATIR